jgi:two-component system sensor histidine kinase DegS
VTSDAAALAAEVGAEDARVRALRTEVDTLGRELGHQQTELAKLEIALRNLESTWLFLERGDSSLVSDGEGLPTDVQMRIIEAQESERSRLAQEVHDGPAQVLSNAIFQVEYIDRVIDTDLRTAKTELRFLRDLLRRELGSVRTFISQLRPPVLDELGLDGAIADAIGRVTALTGLAISSDLSAPADRLSPAEQTVVLRVLQEALQNVRKHGAASAVTVASAIDGDDWVLTVRDDGRGFDVGAVAARGRRNFGLQFMRERAELIGARFEVHSRPDGGTLVRLAIPVGAEESS